MWIAIGSVITIIGLGMVYFHLPSSRLKSEFKEKFEYCMKDNAKDSSVLSKEDIRKLPDCIQKFYEVTKILGKPKQSTFCMYSYDTDFDQNGRKLTIDYYEYIFASLPRRLAYIHSGIAGIPFDGLDSFVDVKGGMKGVIAKNITIFNTRGPKMDKACLATWLAESIFLPVAFLENDIAWDELDETSARATFTYENMTVNAEYHFNERGELKEIFVSDRGLTLPDGTMKECPWSVRFDNYREYGEYYLPAVCQCVWHMEEGDVIYYDAKDSQYDLNVTKPFGNH
ncbi:MAG: hypothetical protein PUC65_13605 [Clostridiales bacterium]|nr:hypothetical protein [Clostridiales bacterium]